MSRCNDKEKKKLVTYIFLFSYFVLQKHSSSDSTETRDCTVKG